MNTFLCVIESECVFFSALSIICLDRNALYKCNVLLLLSFVFLILSDRDIVIVVVVFERK